MTGKRRIGLFIAGSWDKWDVVEKEIIDAIDEHPISSLLITCGAHTAAELRTVNLAVSLELSVAEYRLNTRFGPAAFNERNEHIIEDMVSAIGDGPREEVLALVFGDNDDPTVGTAREALSYTRIPVTGWRFDDTAGRLVRFQERTGEPSDDGST